jgi:hypothetical protein
MKTSASIPHIGHVRINITHESQIAKYIHE